MARRSGDVDEARGSRQAGGSGCAASSRARLDRKSELGLRLTINVILFAAAIWAFAGLLEEVLDNATLVEWDIRLNAWAHAHATAAGLAVLPLRHARRLAGRVGDHGAVRALAALATRAFPLLGVDREQRRRRDSATGAQGDDPSRSSPVRGGVPARAIVQLSERPHDERDDLLVAHGRVRGALARLARQKRMRLYVVSTTIICLIGFSRLYLGVHYPSDVLGGLIIGTAWVVLCTTAIRIVDSSEATRERAAVQVVSGER